MDRKHATLCIISPGLLKDNIPVLIDGDIAVALPWEDLRRWSDETGLDTPIYAHEVDEAMLDQWEWAFNLGAPVATETLCRATMAKPSTYRGIPTRFDADVEYNGGHWHSQTSPCKVCCTDCGALFPVWGEHVLADVQRCAKCGYKYEFLDY